MKNVIIVSKGNTAVAVGDNNQPTITKNETGSFLANLEAIKEVLLSIPVEPSETVHIYLPDLVQGIVSGSAVDYVKTGKTASGNALNESEVAGFKEFYKLYAERILNVRFSQFKYIAKDNVELQNLRKKAWDTLNTTAVTQQTVTTTQTIDPDKAIREALDAQIIKALSDGNMETYSILKAERDKLKQPEVVAVQTTTQATGRLTVETPQFGEADKAFNESSEPAVDENGTPIGFTVDNNVEMAW